MAPAPELPDNAAAAALDDVAPVPDGFVVVVVAPGDSVVAAVAADAEVYPDFVLGFQADCPPAL